MRNEQMTNQRVMVATWAGVTDGTNNEQVIGQPTLWDSFQPHFRVFNNPAVLADDLNGVDISFMRAEPARSVGFNGITIDQCMRARFFGFHSGSSSAEYAVRIEMQRADDDTSRVSVDLGFFKRAGDSPTSNYFIHEPFFPFDFARETVAPTLDDDIRYLFHVTPGPTTIVSCGVVLECYAAHGTHDRGDGGRGFAVGPKIR